MAHVSGRDRVAQFQSRDANLQIRKRNHSTRLPGFRVDARRAFPHLFREGLHLDRGVNLL